MERKMTGATTKARKKIFSAVRALVLAALAVVLASCSATASRKSFIARLDEIDALIEVGQMKDALSRLKKVEGRAFDSWARIGVYRRYALLGQDARAERVLKKGLKKFHANKELSAVYARFLLRRGRVDEALAAGEVLQGGKFGSIYSEACLTRLFISAAQERESFCDEKFLPIYRDAYTGSRDSYWLRNCALIHLSRGDYGAAAALAPDGCDDLEDLYFWSLVSFDAGRYESAERFARAALDRYPMSSIHSRHAAPFLGVSSVLADALVSMSEHDEAEEERRAILSALSDNGALAGPDGSADRVLPVVLVDSALWSAAGGDDERCLSLLSEAVSRWPDFTSALIAYADFALRSSAPLEHDDEEAALLERGIKTLRVEKYDSLPRASIEDARARMESAFERTGDERLYVALADFRAKTDRSLSTAARVAGLWNELEKSATAANVYPPLIFEYALNGLLRCGQSDDAWNLWRKYMSAKYSLGGEDGFWERCVPEVKSFSILEAEYAAYFAALSRRASDALRLLYHCVYERSDDETRPFALVSNATCVNLAAVLSSLGEKGRALDVYAAASSRSADPLEKSEIMRRMAQIYMARNETKEASRAALYALSLNPMNHRAKLLRDTLSARK